MKAFHGDCLPALPGHFLLLLYCCDNSKLHFRTLPYPLRLSGFAQSHPCSALPRVSCTSTLETLRLSSQPRSYAAPQCRPNTSLPRHSARSALCESLLASSSAIHYIPCSITATTIVRKSIFLYPIPSSVYLTLPRGRFYSTVLCLSVCECLLRDPQS